MASFPLRRTSDPKAGRACDPAGLFADDSVIAWRSAHGSRAAS
jgi:hypothetical protein